MIYFTVLLQISLVFLGTYGLVYNNLTMQKYFAYPSIGLSVAALVAAICFQLIVLFWKDLPNRMEKDLQPEEPLLMTVLDYLSTLSIIVLMFVYNLKYTAAMGLVSWIWIKANRKHLLRKAGL